VLNLLTLSMLGLALVDVGVLLRARGKARERYLAKAKEAGIATSELDDVYYTYRINNELVGNLAIWFGVGLIIMGVFRLV
jgi:hypothetical protein